MGVLSGEDATLAEHSLDAFFAGDRCKYDNSYLVTRV